MQVTEDPEFQTRSEQTGLNWHKTFQEAIDAAEQDPTIWKISFSIGSERIRLIKRQLAEFDESDPEQHLGLDPYWVYEPIILPQAIANQTDLA